MKETLITRINDVAIAATSNEQGEVLIPIQPICDALGIAYSRQLAKIKDDETLAPTLTLRVTVGADGKQREMVCMPQHRRLQEDEFLSSVVTLEGDNWSRRYAPRNEPHSTDVVHCRQEPSDAIGLRNVGTPFGRMNCSIGRLFFINY